MNNEKITIAGHHVELTQAMKDQVQEKLGDFFENYNIRDIHVILEVEDSRHRAEATVHIPGHSTLHAEATTGDMYSSIDKMAEKIDAQLEKEHSKQSHHHQKESPKKAEY